MKISIFLIIAFTFAQWGCKKETNNGILGKWKLVAVFDGYANGGNFKWTNVALENSHILDFRDNGQYLRQENINGNNQPCTGTFILQTDNNLEINSTCNTVTERMKISELSSTILIIDRQGFEGIVRYKYAPTK